MKRLGMVVLAILALAAATCASAAELPPVCADDSPVHVSLSMDSPPLVGQEGTVTATVTIDMPLPEVTLDVVLPDDGKVTGSTRISLQNPPMLTPIARSIKLTFASPGNKSIKAVVKAEQASGAVWSAVGYLAVNIGSASSMLGYVPEPPQPAEMITAGGGTYIGEPSAESVATPSPVPNIVNNQGGPNAGPNNPGISAATFTLSGTWRFYDRGDVLTPQRDTLVELRKASDGSHLAYAYTNWNGDYTFAAMEYPGAIGVYVRCITWTDYGSGNLLSVITLGGDQWSNTYTYDGPVMYFADGAQSYGARSIPNGNVNEKAWWIKDDYVKAYWVPSDRSGRHVAEWSSTSAHGTHFHPGGNIHLMAGDADDTPDTVLHEMGHSVMYNIYGNYMPPSGCPSPHYLMGASAPGCGWTEGWAQIWHCWTTNDPIRSYPGGGGVNLETATWGDGYDEGDQVEGRVAGAVWDITDSTNDGTDTYDGDWADVWDVMWNVNCGTFAEFWTQWKARGHNKHGAVASIYRSTIDYNTWPTFGGLPDVTGNEDVFISNAFDLWLYASDPESSDSELVYTITGDSNPGSNPSIDTGDYVDFSPNANWYGSSTITISCTDGIRTRTDSFNVNITAVNDAPVIASLPDRSTNEDIPYHNAIDLWAYTTDPETTDSGLTYTIIGNTNASCGASIVSSRYIDIVPAANWNGTSDVTVRVTDPSGLTDQDTFRITVIAVNDAPVMAGLPDRATNEDTPYTSAIDLCAYTADQETADSGLTYTIITMTNTNCGASIASNRYIDIVPTANWNGVSDVTVRVSDPNGATGQDTFRITVNAVNDPPTIAGILDRLLAKNGSQNNALDLYEYASDIETPDSVLTYTITGNTSPDCGVSIDAYNFVDINPTAGWTGTSNVTIRATDPEGLWDTDMFTITVAQPFSTISAARNNPDGTWVSLTSKLSTVTFPTCFYIEEQDRSSGIRIAQQGGPAAASLVTVAGPLSTSFAERQIIPAYLSSTQSPLSIRPLGLPNGSLGGGAPDPYTVAVPLGGNGAYNVGLLVCVTGRVLEHAGSGRFYMTDGSSVTDPYAADSRLLVDRVTSGWRPPVGSYVSVTGISGASTMSGQPMRILRPRSEQDILVREVTAAYIYDALPADAISFESMLDSNGVSTDRIPFANVTTADLSKYNVILIGGDTGSWTAAGVAAVLAPNTPIIGIGQGGSKFMDAVTTPDLYIGWLHSAVGSSQIGAIATSGDIYSYPFDLMVTMGQNLTLYDRPGTGVVMLYDVAGATGHLLAQVDQPGYFPAAVELDRFYQWGFYGAPDKMTAVGKNLFVNLVFSTVR